MRCKSLKTFLENWNYLTSVCHIHRIEHKDRLLRLFFYSFGTYEVPRDVPSDLFRSKTFDGSFHTSNMKALVIEGKRKSTNGSSLTVFPMY